MITDVVGKSRRLAIAQPSNIALHGRQLPGLPRGCFSDAMLASILGERDQEGATRSCGSFVVLLRSQPDLDKAADGFS